MSLQTKFFTVFLSLMSQNILFLDFLDESGSAAGFSNMFDSNIDSLEDFSVSYSLFHAYTKRSWVNIKDSSGSSVIEVVRHTGLLRRVDNNIDIIPKSVAIKIVVHSDCSVSSEWSFKFMSGS